MLSPAGWRATSARPGLARPGLARPGLARPGRPGRARLWRRRAMALAAAAVAWVPAVALVPAPAARADIVRNTEQWVLDELNVQPAWAITRGSGVTVAVIDSGVDPSIADLAGSVSTGPNLSGVSTPESNPNWGVHGTWMASLIAGHGHDGGSSGIIGMAPASRVLSIRVITDPNDPNYSAYQRESATLGQNRAGPGDHVRREPSRPGHQHVPRL